MFRFLLGVGAGGVYPLSASSSAQSASHGEHSGQRVGWALFWQTPGSMAPYIIALLLLQMPDATWTQSFQFRLLLGLGALPSAVVLFSAWMQPAPNRDEREQAATAAKLKLLTRDPTHWKRLVGTGGTWFLYDIGYYGTAIFTPALLQDIFGADESLTTLSWQALLLTSIGVPAAILAIWCLKPYVLLSPPLPPPQPSASIQSPALAALPVCSSWSHASVCIVKLRCQVAQRMGLWPDGYVLWNPRHTVPPAPASPPDLTWHTPMPTATAPVGSVQLRH